MPTDKQSSPLQQMDGRSDSGVDRPIQCIDSEHLQLRLREHCGRWGRKAVPTAKSQRSRTSATRHNRDATPMRSKQWALLNKTWIMTNDTMSPHAKRIGQIS